jgi:5-methylcytosine-specific restriction endonuclease McrA
MNDQLKSQKSLYQENLEDPRWKRLKNQIQARDRNCCRVCGEKSGLQVHHRQYHRKKVTGEWLKPWEYHPFLLLTLCSSCHSKGHQEFSIPIKDI